MSTQGKAEQGKLLTIEEVGEILNGMLPILIIRSLLTEL